MVRSATDPPTPRARLLQAARDVFAHFGYAGATTRRIAQRASVHEVTMFRLFGSKEALLNEAIRAHATGEQATPLPDPPIAPERELGEWYSAEVRRIGESRAVILKCLAEEAAHPELAHAGVAPLEASATELHRYVERLARDGSVTETDRKAAVTTLLTALFSEALGRKALPFVHTLDPGAAPTLYVRTFLRGLGMNTSASPGPPPKMHPGAPMNTLELDAQLNRMIIDGKSAEAFERFYDENVVAQENDEPARHGRARWMQSRHQMEQSIRQFHARMLSHAANGDVSFSEWEFDVELEGTGVMKMVRVAVRRWKNGRVVSERFYHK